MALNEESMTSTVKLQLAQFQIAAQELDNKYTGIMNEAKEKPLDERLKVLYDGAQRLFDDGCTKQFLENLNTSLIAAQWNTSTMNNLLKSYHNQLGKMLDTHKRRSEYNNLFALIISQWLATQENDLTESITAESLLAKEKLEAIIFVPHKLDMDNWYDFIQNKLFSVFNRHQASKDAWKRFKKQTKEYGQMLLTRKVTATDINRAIQYLLAGDSCDERRKSTLKEMQMNQVTLEGLASLVNALIADLSKWKWPVSGVRGVFRRNFAAKYRCFYQEDDVTAVFLQYVGLQWSYHFKRELRNLFDVLSKNTEVECSSDSIEKERLKRQRNFWMGTLPDEEGDSNDYGDGNYSAVGLKETVLDLIHVEIDLHQTLYPETPLTVVCADVEDFGLLISHEVIQTFLQQCDVPQIWLDFFDRFLKQQVYHQAEDPVRQRQRGVPIAHSVSYLMSELVLFGMDLYVYQNTGIFNYRLHDDFWFFDSQLSKIDQAWTLMKEYGNIVGLTFNKEKCGSTQILPLNTATPPTLLIVGASLPENDVKWGLLTLQKNGQFTPDQRRITPFLNEIKERLSSVRAILEWIKVYNSYMAFFMHHFGRYANVLRARHFEGIVATLRYIHQNLFSENNSSALNTLTHLITERFPECLSGEMIEAWFYWPLKKGGLGIKNVYVDLLSDFEYSPDETTITFAALLAKNRECSDDEENQNDEETSVTSDVTTESSKTDSPNWRDMYIELLEIKDPIYPKLTKVLEEDLSLFEDQATSSPDEENSDENESQLSVRPRRHRHKEVADAYTGWLICQYGEQIKSTFGRLDFIDSNSVPIDLISMIERASIDW
uniref:Reverse transcriptase-like protein n=1 Tax=Adineta vaga TaxID=104782 RepID=G3KGU9_ADIVA|nr:reverse transcriptase-like protein [Adineta vaga]